MPKTEKVEKVEELTAEFTSATGAVVADYRGLTVTDATHSGSVGSLAYTFEVANDEAFTNLFGSWNVPEQPNQTSLDLPRDLSWISVYYWHVRAYDGTTTGTWSRTLAFATPNPPAAPPPVSIGGGDAIDLHQATSVNPNVSSRL